MRVSVERRRFRCSNQRALGFLGGLLALWPLCLFAMSVWWSVFPDPARPGRARDAALAGLVIGGLLLGLPAAGVCFGGGVGTWSVNRRGVVYKPWLRRVRRLRWDEVECVQWFSDSARLQGGATKISLLWCLFGNPDTRREAKEWVRTALSPSIRPVDPPALRPPTLAEARRSRLQGGIFLVVTAGLTLVSYYKVQQDPERNASWMWGLWASMFGPLLLAPFLMARERRRLAIYYRRAASLKMENVPA